MPTWMAAGVGGLFALAILTTLLVGARGARDARGSGGGGKQAAPVASATVSAAATANVTSPPPRGAVEAVVVQRVVHPASTSDAGKTAERDAVDALHSGDARRAAELYGQLAKANPDNAALVDTARLLGEATRTR